MAWALASSHRAVHPLPESRPGWGEGDEISSRFDLFHHQEQAGDGDGLCTITRYDRHTRGFTAACTGIFNLDAGTLDLAGEVTDEAFRTQEIILDVVGGTERFKDAKGVATVTRTGPSGPPADHPGESEQHPNRHRDFSVDVDLA